MKTITLSINIRSFFLGALTAGGILVFANFTPADTVQPRPALLDTRRFQLIVHERETVILDTETGRFVVNPSYLGKPRWVSGDFDALQREGQKK